MPKRRIVLGTRGSKLALRQSLIVKEMLEGAWEGLEVELSIIKTTGDKITDVPLARIGGKGLFVKEIEEALMAGSIDCAVHSMKDVPSELPKGLIIGAIPKREDPRDVLVSASFTRLADLPYGAVVGTSSLRRMVQIRKLRPDLQVEVLRGNLDTRLRRVQEGHFDAVILAAAGIHRMGWQKVIREYFDPNEFLPAVGQGALGIEIREDDRDIYSLVSKLHDEYTAISVQAERSFLRELEGGCQVPIGCHCFFENGSIKLKGMIASLDGSVILRDEVLGKPTEAEIIGNRLARRLLDRGGKEILQSVYGR
ncbi:MAG: hydroxymethylbilane synthase [Syntrophobacterales bacterium]|nr:hydroxymethylbilane synthase [Syntrophobacterales bacterium]